MRVTVKGVVARSKGAPVEVVDIVVPTRARVRQSSRCMPAGSATRTWPTGRATQAEVDAFDDAIGPVARRARDRSIGAGGLVRNRQAVPG